MRQPGYYWVKLDGEWIIAECDGDDQWGHPFPSNYIADDYLQWKTSNTNHATKANAMTTLRIVLTGSASNF